MGFAAALDTLCAQAHGRNPEGTEVGELTQLGCGVCLVLCIPSAIFFLTCGPIVGLVFGPQCVDGATTYLRASVVFLFVFALTACFVKSLQSQHRAATFR